MIWPKVLDEVTMKAKLWICCKVLQVLKGHGLCLPDGSNRNRCQLKHNLRRPPKVHGNIDRRLKVVNILVAAAEQLTHLSYGHCTGRFGSGPE